MKDLTALYFSSPSEEALQASKECLRNCKLASPCDRNFGILTRDCKRSDGLKSSIALMNSIALVSSDMA